jgi:hypothetical protein
VAEGVGDGGWGSEQRERCHPAWGGGAAALRDDGRALGEEVGGDRGGRRGTRGGGAAGLVDDGRALGEEVSGGRGLTEDGRAVGEDSVKLWQAADFFSFSHLGLRKISGLGAIYKGT